MNNIEQLDFHIFRIFRIFHVFHVFHSKHFDVCELGGSHNRQEALPPQGELQRRAAATEAAVLRGSSGEGNWQVMASELLRMANISPRYSKIYRGLLIEDYHGNAFVKQRFRTLQAIGACHLASHTEKLRIFANL